MEAETLLESSRMGLLINGNCTAETSRKRPSENGGDIHYVATLKYKRRKVSAIRDFPKGCGRFAQRVNGVVPSDDGVVANGNVVENLKVCAEGSAIVEHETVKPLESLVESETLELLKTSVDTEFPDLPKGFESETGKLLLKNFDQVEALKPIQNVEPLQMVLPNDLDQTELLELSKNLESKILNKTELLDSIKSSETLMLTDALESAAHPEHTDIPSSSSLQSQRDFARPNNLELSKFFDQPQPSVPLVEALEVRMPKRYPPPRKISAFRDFPPGCGRNAPGFSKQECQKSIVSFKTRSVDDGKSRGEHRPLEDTTITDAKQIGKHIQDGDSLKSELKGNAIKEIVEEDKSEGNITEETFEQVQGRTASERKLKKGGTKETNMRPPSKCNLSRSEPKPQSISKIIDRDVSSSEGKRWEESVNKDKSSKRKLAECEDESGTKNQCEEESTGFEFSDNRMIVLALMAEQNCPWRQQGKQSFKSNPTSGSSRSKIKNAAVGQVRDKVASRKKKDEAENSEGKFTKNKSPPAGMAAYRDINQPVFSDGEDSPDHNEEDLNAVVVQRSQELDLTLIPFGLHTSSDIGDSCQAATRNKVRETLRLFQTIFRKLLQEEETKSKVKGNTVKRIDLLASTILKDKNIWVNTGKQILGPVPGVEVGDEFHYRVELAIIGLHRQYQGGIDYLKEGGRILATSIVASGGYADDTDSSDVLVYSGQGGNPTGKGKQPEDQKLERGNLSLKCSMDAKTSVRVIRGFKETKATDSGTKGRVVATYIYDGLYLVEKYWQEKGQYGTSVFKFQLRRIPGQPELALKEVTNSKKSKVRKGLCVDDISQGKETPPVGAVNTLDDEKPPPFNYTVNVIYPKGYNPISPRGCECTDGCSDSEKCFCAVKNGGEIPFNYNGDIVHAKRLVYECGPSCKCPPSCHNRVSQHGIKFQLEIFKTERRGWGVRSLTSIPSGSFICEYTGELLEDKEADQRTGTDEYLFDIGHNYNDHALWDGLSTLIPGLQSSSCEVVEDVGFTIDAAYYGNVGRFINHSCSPNLYAQNVLYDHDDKRMPHIMLFAAENIPPLHELTYHYNYMIDQVTDSDGNIKKKNCYCGSFECTGRMY